MCFLHNTMKWCSKPLQEPFQSWHTSGLGSPPSLTQRTKQVGLELPTTKHRPNSTGGWNSPGMGPEFNESPHSEGSSFSCLLPEIFISRLFGREDKLVKSKCWLVCFRFLIGIGFSFEKKRLWSVCIGLEKSGFALRMINPMQLFSWTIFKCVQQSLKICYRVVTELFCLTNFTF